MRTARLLLGTILLCACGPEPAPHLIAVFAPDFVVATTAQPAILELRLQNTGRGTASMPAPTDVWDGLRVRTDPAPEASGATPPSELRAKASPAPVALPPLWAYGQQKAVRLDLSAAYAEFTRPGAFRATWSHPAFAAPASAALRVVEPGARIRTNFGEIDIEFHPEDAPRTVINFISLARKKFYDGLSFHRIIPGFMMQGGCPKGDGTGDAGYKIKAEFNARKHTAGTVSMARAQDPDSAGSQFFICFGTASHLDGQYTAFAQVVRGMDVVRKIEGVGSAPLGRPMERVVMESVTLLESLPGPK